MDSTRVCPKCGTSFDVSSRNAHQECCSPSCGASLRNQRRYAQPPRTDVKRCRRCGEEKRAEEFYKAPKNRDGLGPYCRPCHKAANQEAHERRFVEGRTKEQRLAQERRDATPFKRCRVCGDTKPTSEFTPRITSPDGFRNICKTCNNAYSVQYTRQLRARRFDPDAKEKQCRTCGETKPMDSFHRSHTAVDGHRLDCRACVIEKLSRSKWGDAKYGVAPAGHQICAQCGECKPLDRFHHVGQTTRSYDTFCASCRNAAKAKYRYEHPDVAAGIGARDYAKNKEKILARCSESRQRRQQWFRDLKESLDCARCGEDEPVCLDFHHLDPGTKALSPSQMIGRGYSRDEIMTELKACIVLCSNCHRKEHARQKGRLKHRAS